MIRMAGLRSAGVRAAGILGFAMLVAATPRPASAQAAAAPQDDPFKFSTNAPVMVLMQIAADKTADFETAWAAMRAGLAKSESADVKSFGESLGKMWKVDQPAVPVQTAAGPVNALLYILQIDAPSTTISYNPFKTVYEVLWNATPDKSILKREEADEIYNKLKAAFASINPPWKLVKVGG
jgi:hypothetical protein